MTSSIDPGTAVSSIGNMGLDERIKLEQRLLGRQRKGSRATAIPRRDDSGPCAPSFAQTRLWLVEQINPVAGTYHIYGAYRIHGALNPEALRDALDALVARQEALRTRLVLRDGVLQQRFEPHCPFALQQVDLRGRIPKNRLKTHSLIFFIGMTRDAFDLAADCMLRAGLARLGDQEFVLTITLHHIAADGWSLGVLDRELEVLYAACSRALPCELPPLPIQYSDYAVWQREWLSGATLETQLAFWRKQLSGLTTLELPTDRARPAQSSFRGEVERFTLPDQLVTPIKALARRNNATLYMTLLAAFQVLLMRYSGQEDIAIGSPVAGRNRPELEGLIGFFVNTLVMRGDLSGNPSFVELLTRTRQRALDAYGHQELPFEKLVEELGPERDMSRNPLVQVMFALQNTPATALRLPGLEIERIPLAPTRPSSTCPSSSPKPTGNSAVAFEYATDLFDAATIARMAGHFTTLLEGIVAQARNPGQ